MTNANSTSRSHPVTLVTGGSRGIGRATVRTLAARGHDVILTYVRDESAALEAVAEVREAGGKAEALALDAGNVSSFADFAARVQTTLLRLSAKGLTNLVHNAGIGGYGPVVDVKEADFDALMAVHFKGPFFLTQALLPLLVDGGHIVHLSSGLARYVVPGVSVYSAAKSAIEALTRSLAVELGPRRIAVNAVAPGGVATDFAGGMLRDPALQERVAKETPLGRMGEPDDVAGVIAMLLSDDARWITGQRIEVTGGYRL